MSDDTKNPKEEAEEEKKQENHRGDSDTSCLVPQLAEQNITYGDLQTAIQVLNAVSQLGGNSHKKRKTVSTEALEAYKQSNLRPFRKALASCLELHQRTMFDGKSEEEYYEQKIANRTLKRQKTAERDLHHKYIANTLLRKGRIEKLNAMKQDGYDEEISKLLIPDGHVDVPVQALPSSPTLLLQTETQATATMKTLKTDQTAQALPPPSVELPCLRSCYVCKVRYRRLHHFYDQLCPDCAQLNWEKRHQSVDLTGRVAVVTGARVKIGYQVVLKLLRAGATVIATTRFPNTAVQQYRQRETDFDEQYAHQLHVYGLDLRDAAGIEAFTRFLKLQFGNPTNGKGIDILINNACQTIRRPAGYYRPFVQAEQELWKNGDDTHKNMLKGCLEFERLRRRIVMDHQEQKQTTNQSHSIPCLLPDPTAAVKDNDVVDDVATAITKSSSTNMMQVVAEEIGTPFETTGISHATAMSQMVILPEDAGVSEDILPPGVSDINGQQLDLRQTNSWLLKMEEVSTPEVIECMFVNAIAPFVLNARLKPLMTMPQNDSRPDRYIINVSAMEGKVRQRNE
jgi:NAD(P)-dependent dehydrogenase (short-subunit alcohol dehydrogenase family)